MQESQQISFGRFVSPMISNAASPFFDMENVGFLYAMSGATIKTAIPSQSEALDKIKSYFREHS